VNILAVDLVISQGTFRGVCLFALLLSPTQPRGRETSNLKFIHTGTV